MWILANDQLVNTSQAMLVIFYTAEQDVSAALHTAHQKCTLGIVKEYHAVMPINTDVDSHWQWCHCTHVVQQCPINVLTCACLFLLSVRV